MSFPNPKKLSDWDLDYLDKSIQYVDIESEILDFKSEINELEIHLCAMANTSGGFLVLGVREVKNPQTQKIIKFEKKGFDIGKEDFIQRSVGNAIFNIEPNPVVRHNHIKDGEKFYTVLQIENNYLKKPYFIKNKGACYVRIDNSSRPASRSVILNLFKNSVEVIKNIENLRSVAKLLKEELVNTHNYIKAIPYAVDSIAPTIDLSLFRHAISTNETFLRENNFLRENSITDNVSHVFHIIELMNSHVKAFNRSTIPDYKKRVQNDLIGNSNTLAMNLNVIPKILDRIAETCDKFLQNQNG